MIGLDAACPCHDRHLCPMHRHSLRRNFRTGAVAQLHMMFCSICPWNRLVLPIRARMPCVIGLDAEADIAGACTAGRWRSVPDADGAEQSYGQSFYPACRQRIRTALAEPAAGQRSCFCGLRSPPPGAGRYDTLRSGLGLSALERDVFPRSRHRSARPSRNVWRMPRAIARAPGICRGNRSPTCRKPCRCAGGLAGQCAAHRGLRIRPVERGRAGYDWLRTSEYGALTGTGSSVASGLD